MQMRQERLGLRHIPDYKPPRPEKHGLTTEVATGLDPSEGRPAEVAV